MPPATTTSASPERIIWSARWMAYSPERQTLLTVRAGTPMGMPAFTAACRAGFCPWPACSTCPITTWSTVSAGTPERPRAAAIAMPPSSIAEHPARALPILPMGVRA